ncbi:hypothetical protein [Dermatophilus congolensis]|uniref:hypothetical protein n=1 Tax=Dermatophilus congolensis TaxID=1863 RepID=UPI001AAEFB90|nr:hypothetical protein [Dermatophilus congolensis]MBO3143776.1 hypothetical protein [Dermatophilus congolensis]MBO3152767.1 hypothetical protein [Dermatophilus congolensis]MBO3160222.1 hypothetical protein [Dermatophilus congolensis]MBO3164052.1 hypothetical protein [Dermatophilus congolensis]MBO3177597.1 hypothetical protein [Dermatophilus congolensis]
MKDSPNKNALPVSLDIYASGTCRVQLTNGVQYRNKNRLDLEARVDPETGEVRLFVDTAALQRHLNQQ